MDVCKIHRLPEAVANQIAAGEVVRNPAMVVKELMDNAIDAGSSKVKVIVLDAGRTLVQVIDNGCGMGEDDAMLAFERHATSKIGELKDLFTLSTMGFRGEALASIASVAQVELITRRQDDELGIKIEIAANEIISKEFVTAPKGSQFAVKNLFYNIPARRRFLKSDKAEFRNIASVFLRIALAHPEVELTLVRNGSTVYNFQSSNRRTRIAAVAGNQIDKNLLPVSAQTDFVKISGYVGNTQITHRSQGGDQYFYANNRFMKSPYMHKAVTQAYVRLLPEGVAPPYYIFIDVDPRNLDVNVDPQKSEIDFEDASAIFSVLTAAVRECLGKYNVMPSLEFDEDDLIRIPTVRAADVVAPEDARNGNLYNPFDTSDGQQRRTSASDKIDIWAGLYNPKVENGRVLVKSLLGSGRDIQLPEQTIPFMQFDCRLILTPMKSGLMVIDQHRAHYLIQYAELRRTAENEGMPGQRLAFPEEIPMGAEDACLIEEIEGEMKRVGLEVHYDTDKGNLIVAAIPAVITNREVHTLIEALLDGCREGEVDLNSDLNDYVCRRLAMHAALPYGRVLSRDEMQDIYNRLFALSEPTLTPDGKSVFKVINLSVD